MSAGNSFYDVMPKAIYVLDKNGELIYGKKPKETDDFIISENKLELCGREYRINCLFSAKGQKDTRCFSSMLEMLTSLISKENVIKKEHIFAYLYTFLCSIIKNEISNKIIFAEADREDTVGSVCVGSRGYVAVFSILAHYLCKNSFEPSFSYKKELDGFYTIITSDDANAEIPQFIMDYCLEIANANGFTIELERESSHFAIKAKMETVCTKNIVLSSYPDENISFIPLICYMLVA